MTPDEIEALAAQDEEQEHMSMQLINEESDRRSVDLDPPDPLAGLDTERLASFNLKQIRTVMGVSQQQIADKLTQDRAAGHHDVKLSQTQIAKIERGERPWRLNELVAISLALGVEMYEFFNHEPASSDSKMLVRTAKLKYQRAQAHEESVRGELRAAVRAKYEAENELVRVAARHQIRDETILHILSLRGVRDYWAKETEKMGIPNPEDRKAKEEHAIKFAADEWLKLTKEETGKSPVGSFSDLPTLDS
ncbi:helix-turn-helix domain-containing protein [Streptomyces parvulus]|uniref:helix-turn-helix domain-containing protein n=1 Tax=Streptomyces parvulus TaxID=146923 RepID=UPI003682AC4B